MTQKIRNAPAKGSLPVLQYLTPGQLQVDADAAAHIITTSYEEAAADDEEIAA
tara:strand:+ start:592 stop:750 length:159 start_codon:yes stop_codon:yes gene_type:complete